MLLGEILRLRGGASGPGHFDPHPRRRHSFGENNPGKKPLTSGDPVARPHVQAVNSRSQSEDGASASLPAGSSSSEPHNGNSSSNLRLGRSSRTTPQPSSSNAPSVKPPGGSTSNQGVRNEISNAVRNHDYGTVGGIHNVNNAGLEMTEIRFIDKDIGLGVFALQNIPQNSIIFTEEAVFDAPWSGPRTGNNMDIFDRYRGFGQTKLDALHGAFPKLARANLIDCQRSYRHRNLISTRLELNDRVRIGALREEQHKILWDRDYKMRDHIRHRLSRLSRSLGRYGLNGYKRSAERTIAWFTEYSHRVGTVGDPMVDGRARRAVFLVASLMNSRCNDHNCQLRYAEGANGTTLVRVRALRAITAGEELTLNYRFGTARFKCKADCCHPPPGQDVLTAPDPDNPLPELPPGHHPPPGQDVLTAPDPDNPFPELPPGHHTPMRLSGSEGRQPSPS